jgi:hypothetical protein
MNYEGYVISKEREYMKKKIMEVVVVLIIVLMTGCVSSMNLVRVEPIEVKPLTVNLNINICMDDNVKSLIK